MRCNQEGLGLAHVQASQEDPPVVGLAAQVGKRLRQRVLAVEVVSR